MDLFLRLNNTDWTAINALGTLALIVVSSVAGAIAYYQVTSARLENRKSRTMSAIEKYDSDIILDRALLNLRAARIAGFKEPADCKMDLLIVMNYLDTIALGIDKKLYDDDLVRTFMESIIKEHMREFVDDGLLVKSGANPSDFKSICELYKKWES